MDEKARRLAWDRAYSAAWVDFLDRMFARDPDTHFYMPGQPRPPYPWWRRALRLAPKRS